ncbi:MAG: lipoate--protein ligase family protein, partial [Solirubrobacterales bacterium]|nr:lipoate--protein ligase family protein [Solirubrobacterales bacterium]
VFRPGPTVAFGRRDASLAGFGTAVTAAEDAGYAAVLRLGGGHAAAYDEGSVLVELITRERAVGVGIEPRFAALAARLEEALRAVGIAPVVGELPGEYCPGRWSLHAEDSGIKLAGLAQRSIRGAALTTAVVVVEGGRRIRGVLEPVYAALGLPWDPSTAGAAEDVRPGLRAGAFADAVAATLEPPPRRGAERD